MNSIIILPPGTSQVALVVKNPPVSSGDIKDVGLVPESGRSLEEGMATHSSILAWRIPWTKEPGRLQSVGSQRVGHNWSNWAQTLFAFQSGSISHDLDFILKLRWIVLWTKLWQGRGSICSNESFEVRSIFVQILGLPHVSCVPWGKQLSLSEW